MKKAGSSFLRIWMKIFFFIIGTASLIIGAIGVLLPIIPGTPFIVFGVICYLKSCKPLARLILRNRQVREYVEDYKTGSGITISTKILSLGFSLLSFAISIFLVQNIWVRSTLILIYGTIALKILFTKTRKKSF